MLRHLSPSYDVQLSVQVALSFNSRTLFGVGALGKRTASVEGSSVQQLATKFVAADFYSMDDAYESHRHWDICLFMACRSASMSSQERSDRLHGALGGNAPKSSASWKTMLMRSQPRRAAGSNYTETRLRLEKHVWSRTDWRRQWSFRESNRLLGSYL